jgi:hypothetical protein
MREESRGGRYEGVDGQGGGHSKGVSIVLRAASSNPSRSFVEASALSAMIRFCRSLAEAPVCRLVGADPAPGLRPVALPER